MSRKETILSSEARMCATAFPCGQCLHCRINKAREWTHRLLLEQMVHPSSCFVTLTYDDEHLPDDNSVSKVELQKFLKRLRRKTYAGYDFTKIRYFGVGEYGEKTQRPHYHVALFGIDDTDEPAICESWSDGQGNAKGFAHVGEVNSDSARYITGYVVKKLNKRNPKLGDREPEFMLCSKQKGGIGIGAVDQIAEKLRSNKYFNPEKQRIIREVAYGRKSMPLGRYLTEKLRLALNQSDYKKYCEQYDHQEEVFEKHMQEEKKYYLSLVEEKEVKRRQQEVKQKLFRSKRSI